MGDLLAAHHDALQRLAEVPGLGVDSARQIWLRLERGVLPIIPSSRRLKSATDIRNPRIEKREQTSANRWHVEVRLEKPAHIDRQLTAWLKAAYDLAGPRE